MSRMARSAASASPDWTACATSMCQRMATGSGCAGIRWWWVRPARTAATTPLSAAIISLPDASSSVRWNRMSATRYASRSPDRPWTAMSMTAPVSVPHCAGVARRAASAAATGSSPRRSSPSERSCSSRPGPSSRQPMICGSNRFHRARSATVMPTRRRLVTMPIDSRTRIASRTTDRETPNRASSCSIRSTSPAPSAPDVIIVPSRSRTLPCSPVCALSTMTQSSHEAW